MNPILTEIKNDISGIAALADWLGDSGRPVALMLAEFRAQRCIAGDDGKPCRMNKYPRWWEKAKGEVANYIRRELEVKNGMELRVSCEDRLHLCAACGCALPLKVHTPIAHIRAHTGKENLDKMPSFCWIKTEIFQTPVTP